jgi:hypothetical protein
MAPTVRQATSRKPREVAHTQLFLVEDRKTKPAYTLVVKSATRLLKLNPQKP